MCPLTTWWLIPLSKWVITPVISGLTLLIPFITGVITHLRAVGWATKWPGFTISETTLAIAIRQRLLCGSYSSVAMESARLWREVASHANSAPGWRIVGANGVPTNLEQSSESFASVDSMKHQQKKGARKLAKHVAGPHSLTHWGMLGVSERKRGGSMLLSNAFNVFWSSGTIQNTAQIWACPCIPWTSLSRSTHFQVVDISRTKHCFKPKPEASYRQPVGIPK